MKIRNCHIRLSEVQTRKVLFRWMIVDLYSSLLEGFSGSKKLMLSQRWAEVLGRNRWRLPNNPCTSGSGKHLKAWRTLFFIYLLLEIEIEGTCVTKEEESELTVAQRSWSYTSSFFLLHIYKYKIEMKYRDNENRKKTI